MFGKGHGSVPTMWAAIKASVTFVTIRRKTVSIPLFVLALALLPLSRQLLMMNALQNEQFQDVIALQHSFDWPIPFVTALIISSGIAP